MSVRVNGQIVDGDPANVITWLQDERDRLTTENVRLKELWYQDADPDETEFHLDYRAALAKVKETGK